MRGPFNKDHGNRTKALLKSTPQHLYYIQWSSSSQLSLKNSFLLSCKILGQLVKTLAVHGKYRLLNWDTLLIPIQMQLSKKQNTFSQFFAAFPKSRINFEHFEKKVDPHTFCIFEITDSENVAWEMSENSGFRGCLYKQYSKSTQVLLNSASQHFYHNCWPLARKLSWKKSLLLTWNILGLLVHTLAANDKYHILNRDNLKIQIQMQFSLKQKAFSLFFAAFLKSILNFKHFQKMMSLLDFASSKLRTP